jgi:hypothetical protein
MKVCLAQDARVFICIKLNSRLHSSSSTSHAFTLPLHRHGKGVLLSASARNWKAHKK